MSGGREDLMNYYDQMEMVFKPEMARLRAIAERYDELIYSVATKHPGEDRHDTALRYIRERENRVMVPGESIKKAI